MQAKMLAEINRDMQLTEMVTVYRSERTSDHLSICERWRASPAKWNSRLRVRPTLRSVLDALEVRYPVLRGTLRDHVTPRRRPFIRFFACQ